MGEPVRLTVKERILLHLLFSGRSKEEFEVPRAMAQEGIAEACWASQRHLAQYLRPLMERGLVHERQAHVQGVRQRRKVYSLTESGRQAALTLRNDVMEATVQVENGSSIRELTVKQAIAEAPLPTTPLAILRLARQGEPIRIDDARLLSGPPRVEELAEAPRIEGFVGRTEELESITSEKGGPRLFVIRGVAGIGKSGLASRACDLLRGKRNLFWHRVRPWDSRGSVLARLGAFLTALGKPGLRAVLMRSHAERAGEVLREDLPGTEAVLVFDDAQEADVALQPFFRLLLDALSRVGDVRVLLLTRTALPFYSRRDAVVGGLVRELELEGLRDEEVNDYLAQHQLPKEAAEFARKLHGHPLFLELLRAHNPLEGGLVDVRRYLEEEVYTKLPQPEREMMKFASLYRVPVPRGALFANPEWSHDMLLSLAHRSLIRRVGGEEERFEAHDTIRDFFADFLTPAERRFLGDFAVERLRALASEARFAHEFHRCSSYLANAAALSADPAEQAVLWEALGDVSLLLGDQNAVSDAYRAVARLAPDQETKVRAHRKMALALEERFDSAAAAQEVKAGLEMLGDAPSVERGWLLLARSRERDALVKKAEARADVERALATFREFAETQGEAKALLQLAWVLRGAPRSPKDPGPRELLEEVLVLAEALDDSELAARAHTMMALAIADEGGEVGEVEEHFKAVEALEDAMENIWIRLGLLRQRAVLRGIIDTNFEGRAADAQQMIRLARSVRSEFDMAFGTYFLASVSILKGDLDKALQGYQEAAAVWLRYGHPVGYGNALFHAAQVCTMQGNAEGVKRIRTEIEAHGGGGDADETIYPLAIHALDLLTEGNLDDAGKVFEDLIERLEQNRDSGGKFVMMLPRAHYIYGAALRAQGRESEAQEHLYLAREYIERDRAFGQLVKMEKDVPRLIEGLRGILRS